jgi:glycosyltransferase involved in cell wall biosynthesis
MEIESYWPLADIGRRGTPSRKPKPLDFYDTAMAAGLPVVCSQGSALEEVAGGAATLVDPLDTASIANGIESLLADPTRLAEILSRIDDGIAASERATPGSPGLQAATAIANGGRDTDAEINQF